MARKKTTKKKTKATKKAASKPTAKRAKQTAKKTTKKAVKKTAKKATKKTAKKTSASGAAASSARSRRKKLKSPLTKAQLKHLRQMLLEKRRSLVGDMNGMEAEALGRNRGTGSGDLSTMPDHPANIASDNYEQEFMLGLLESERAMLEEINEAIQRIDDGTYGVCVGTGKPIGLTRLKARPWAKYCIEYARMVEKGLVKPGQGLYQDELDSDADDEG